jgi:NAD(P)-dependent dehydrogenase (short-subunit alcohol dehydrogenase family)
MAPSLKYKNDGSGSLHQRVAIVTGASSGMGRGIALALAREGAHVVCSDLVPDARSDGFEEDKDIPTHTVINNNGGKALYQKCDMSKTAEIFALISFAVKVRICPVHWTRHF